MEWWQIVLVCWAIILAGALLLGWLNYRQKTRQENEREAMRRRHAFGPWRWSQDGYIRYCKFCSVPDYGGDDYEGGPR